MSARTNGIFFPGRGSGQGGARNKVCTSQSPYGLVKGNVVHDTIRFGHYVDNNYPVHVKKDKNGFVTNKASCGKYLADGRDNGAYYAIQDAFEYKSGAIGQYSAGDIQYLRITVLHSVLYWKQSKVFAEGQFAHCKDSTFADAKIMGPSGQFTFGVENVRFLGDGGGPRIMSGQHCGLPGYFYGQHGVMCAAQYVLQNVSFSDATKQNAIEFGASGGNPVQPTFATMKGDDSLGMSCRAPSSPIPSAECMAANKNPPTWTLVSGYLDGFTNVAGCLYYKTGVLGGGDNKRHGAFACPFPVRRMTLYSDDQGEVKLSGPGYSGVVPNPHFPVFGANAGYMVHSPKMGYTAPLIVGESYTIELNSAYGLRLEYSDNILQDKFGVTDTVTIKFKIGKHEVTCVASSQDCFVPRAGYGSCAHELHELNRMVGGFTPVRIVGASASSEKTLALVPGKKGQICGKTSAPWDPCLNRPAHMAIDGVGKQMRMWLPKDDDASPHLHLNLESAPKLGSIRILWETADITKIPKEGSAGRPRLAPGTCEAPLVDTSLSEPTGKGPEYWLEDGCHEIGYAYLGDAGKHQLGKWAAPDQAIGDIACCSTAADRPSFLKQCRSKFWGANTGCFNEAKPKKFSFVEAKETCGGLGNGFRLCTKAELLKPKASGCCGTGCGINVALVWTSESRGEQLKAPTAAVCQQKCLATKTCTHYTWEAPIPKASQSSTAWGAAASRAIDGNADTNFAKSTCTFADSSNALVLKSAAASRQCNGQLASMAIDGQTNTRWASCKAPTDTNTWIEVELAKPATVGSLEVKFETARALTVNLYGKPVGSTEYKLIAGDVATKGTSFAHTFDAAATFQMTHLKMESLTEYNGGMYGTSIFEMSLYGVKDDSKPKGVWWEVDLGAKQAIQTVRVTNRGDGGNGNKLNGFYLAVDGVKCATNVQIGNGATLDVGCVTEGRVVRIGLEGDNKELTLCEVKVLPEGQLVSNSGYQGVCTLGTDGTYTPKTARHRTSGTCAHSSLSATAIEFEGRTKNPDPFDFKLSGRSRSTDGWTDIANVTRARGEAVTVLREDVFGDGQRFNSLRLSLPKQTGVMEVYVEGTTVAPDGWGYKTLALEEGQALGGTVTGIDTTVEACVTSCDTTKGCNSFSYCGGSCYMKTNAACPLEKIVPRDKHACKTWYRSGKGDAACAGAGSSSGDGWSSGAGCAVGYMATSKAAPPRKATQFSTAWGADAFRAIDGKASTKFEDNSCTHTGSELARKHWQVDLGIKTTFAAVQVTNRGDGLGSRLNGFDVFVDNVKCAEDVQIESAATLVIPCKAAAGRVVKIAHTQQTTEPLSICEVRIVIDTPPSVIKDAPGKCADCAVKCDSRVSAGSKCGSYECGAASWCHLNKAGPEVLRWPSQTFCTRLEKGEAISLKSATASKQCDGKHSASMAIDGQASSRWSSCKTPANTKTWIEVELAKPSVVGWVEVTFETARAYTMNMYGKPVGKTEYKLLAKDVKVPGTAFRFTLDPATRVSVTHFKMESLTEYNAGLYGTSIFEIKLSKFGALPKPETTQTTQAPTTTTAAATTAAKVVYPWEKPCPGRAKDGSIISMAEYIKLGGVGNTAAGSHADKLTDRLPGQLEALFKNGLLLAPGYAFYWTLDETTRNVKAALHCDDCEGWMAVGFPDTAGGNRKGSMVTSHAIIGTCADSAANIHEYKLTQYHVDGVKRLADKQQSLSGTACSVGASGRTLFFERPKWTAAYNIPIGDNTGEKLIWAVGVTNELTQHKTVQGIVIAGEGPDKGEIQASDSDRNVAAGMGSAWWPMVEQAEGRLAAGAELPENAKFWLECACPDSKVCDAGKWGDPKEALGNVQCCIGTHNDETTSCRRKTMDRKCFVTPNTKGDDTMVTHASAGELCEAQGQRLCTKEELRRKDASSCCTTGCGLDNLLVWSADADVLYPDCPAAEGFAKTAAGKVSDPVSCGAGFTGTKTRTCKVRGTWGGITTTGCIPDCPADGDYPQTAAGKSTGLIKCGKGLTGAKQRACKADGTWGPVNDGSEFVGCYNNYCNPSRSTCVDELEQGNPVTRFIGGHLPGHSVEQCRRLAEIRGHQFFGMENPGSSAVLGEAQCITLAAMPGTGNKTSTDYIDRDHTLAWIDDSKCSINTKKLQNGTVVPWGVDAKGRPLGRGRYTAVFRINDIGCKSIAEKYWLQDGCPEKGSLKQGQYAYADEAVGYVQCCKGRPKTTCARKDETGQCFSKSWSQIMYTYPQAAAMCQDAGARLCSQAEIEAKASLGCCGTGCGLDHNLVWTTDAFVDDYWAGDGCEKTGKGLYDVNLPGNYFASHTKAAGVQCCSEDGVCQRKVTTALGNKACIGNEQAVSLTEAAELCHGAGLRLCSKTELADLNSACCHTGCSLDNELSWTLTNVHPVSNSMANDGADESKKDKQLSMSIVLEIAKRLADFTKEELESVKSGVIDATGKAGDGVFNNEDVEKVVLAQAKVARGRRAAPGVEATLVFKPSTVDPAVVEAAVNTAIEEGTFQVDAVIDGKAILAAVNTLIVKIDDLSQSIDELKALIGIMNNGQNQARDTFGVSTNANGTNLTATNVGGGNTVINNNYDSPVAQNDASPWFIASVALAAVLGTVVVAVAVTKAAAAGESAGADPKMVMNMGVPGSEWTLRKGARESTHFHPTDAGQNADLNYAANV